ncbi:hypothetical protein [Celeribacter persicus]|uniref:Uncharacterized protein n=1 Tax=Celeribacter persicus TaxID=1651082 RepID=A0A2T5HTX3_9RHOB|nr:hypothetical protein [Celeribacter persicus]PTQ75035.1 hypothetical protein C8N42_103328 [Celeribacter persicus]
MIRFLILLALLVAFPQGLRAEVIEVRSGEHAGFSRLVMQFPSVVTWEFGRSGNEYEFRVPDADVEFDAKIVFSKIPQTRIVSVNGSDSRLIVSVRENVHADVFELRAGRIVIDIKDGAPEAASVFEQKLSEVSKDSAENSEIEPAEPSPVSASASEALLAADGQEHMGIPHNDTLVEVKPLELPIIIPGAANDVEQPMLLLPDDAELSDPRSERVDKLERELIEQIGRAVSQGLLDADVSSTERVVEEANAYQGRGEKTELSPPQPEVVASTAERSHIRIQSSIDRESANRTEAQATDVDGNICIKNQYVDISNWGKPPDEGLQLAILRAATLGEFDQPDPEGIQRLSRYYIFLTFGAEAKAVMTNFGVYADGEDVLRAMADIMDQGYSDRPGRLKYQFHCEGPVAFWSVMVKKQLSTWENYNLDSVRATFSALPIHLRRHLGPTLSERFLAIGDEKTAQYIQNAIARAGGDHGDAFSLLDAELTLADGDLASGVTKLEDIVLEDGLNAAEALVRLIATKAQAGQAIDRKTAETAEVMAVEYRGSPYEVQLQNAAILARIHSGDADIAMRQLLDQSANVSNEKQDALLSDALLVLSRDADTTRFSKVMLGHINEISHMNLSDVARLEGAKRLLSAGFFKETLELMAGYATQDGDEAKRVLAEAFLGIGEPEAALRYASQLEDEEGKRLTAKAHFYLNDAESALRALDGLEPGVESDALSIIAADWSRLERSNVPEMSQLAEIVQQNTLAEETGEESPPSLSSVRDMISSSQKTRDALDALLN